MKCQRLNSDGKRCKRKAIYKEHYHGDHEIYTYNYSSSKDMTWVLIFVCGHHLTVDKESENFLGKIEEEDLK